MYGPKWSWSFLECRSHNYAFVLQVATKRGWQQNFYLFYPCNRAWSEMGLDLCTSLTYLTLLNHPKSVSSNSFLHSANYPDCIKYITLGMTSVNESGRLHTGERISMEKKGIQTSSPFPRIVEFYASRIYKSQATRFVDPKNGGKYTDLRLMGCELNAIVISPFDM